MAKPARSGLWRAHRDWEAVSISAIQLGQLARESPSREALRLLPSHDDGGCFFLALFRKAHGEEHVGSPLHPLPKNRSIFHPVAFFKKEDAVWNIQKL